MRRSLTLAAVFVLLGCERAPQDPAATAPTRSTADARVDPPTLPTALGPVPGDGPTERALRDAQAAVRRNPGRGRPLLQLAQLYVRKARESSDPGFYAQADECVTEALRLDPDDLAALQVRGLVFMQDHRFADAKRLADRSLARAPQQPIFWGLLGDAEMEVGHYDQAERAYQRMIDLRPNLASYSRGAWMRWLLGDVDGALDLARRAVEAGSPRAPEELAWAIVQLGNLHLARGDAREANTHFEAALRAFPQYPPALDGRGRAKLAMGDARGAIEDLRAAVEGSTTTEHLAHLGDALDASGSHDEARAVWARAERMGRRSDPRTLASLYADQARETESAVALARTEVAARPDDVYSLDVLAWALLRAGRLDEAAVTVDRARRLHTREARFSFHAGMIAAAQGHREAAVTLLREALAWNAHFDRRGVEEATATLARLGAAPR